MKKFHRVTQIINIKKTPIWLFEDYSIKIKDFRIVTSSCVRNVTWTWLMSREISVVQIIPGRSAPGGLEHLPYGQNHLGAVWKLKHIFGLRSVSPISSHTLFQPAAPSLTKANQHLRRPVQVSPGSRASGKSCSTLPCVLISLTKQTSNYVEITPARRLEHSMLAPVWREDVWRWDGMNMFAN